MSRKEESFLWNLGSSVIVIVAAILMFRDKDTYWHWLSLLFAFVSGMGVGVTLIEWKNYLDEELKIVESKLEGER